MRLDIFLMDNFDNSKNITYFDLIRYTPNDSRFRELLLDIPDLIDKDGFVVHIFPDDKKILVDLEPSSGPVSLALEITVNSSGIKKMELISYLDETKEI